MKNVMVRYVRGEGCEKQMQPILREVVTAVLPFCQDVVRNVKCEGCEG